MTTFSATRGEKVVKLTIFLFSVERNNTNTETPRNKSLMTYQPSSLEYGWFNGCKRFVCGKNYQCEIIVTAWCLLGTRSSAMNMMKQMERMSSNIGYFLAQET